MQLVFATNNPNKIKEVQALVPSHIKLLSLGDIKCTEELPETTGTIEGNAKQKADYIKTHYGYDCFADDTGLEVDALDGEPGVDTAFYAGPQRNADANMAKLLKNLEDKDNRNAHFKTVIALHLNDEYHEFTGICKGSITTEKQGKDGFGYDPVFKAKGYDRTFAEITLEEKNKIGHRGKAVQQLIELLDKL
ncbi:non-canonical purine NTP diphosphatase [Winogradskyella poriferorum]|uniref:non-canonical purine NTP diphosphatase n=1 Tax=Winogradskyella poriferorum TaxID=307627 RepID=UPI003D659F60